MRTTFRIAITTAALTVTVGLTSCSVAHSPSSAVPPPREPSVVVATATALAAPVREVEIDDIPRRTVTAARREVISAPGRVDAAPAPAAPAPVAAAPVRDAAASTPAAAARAPGMAAAPSTRVATPAPTARAAAPHPAPPAPAAPAARPTPAPTAAPKAQPAVAPSPTAKPVPTSWQISIGGWARGIVAGSQSAIDACGPAVLYSSSFPGSGGNTWLNGHNDCGFQFWTDLPVGSTVTITHGPAVFTYRIVGHGYVPQQGISSAGLIHNDLTLQTCKGPGTSFTYADRV